MVVPNDAEIIERLLQFDNCISARRIMSYDVRTNWLNIFSPACRRRTPSETGICWLNISRTSWRTGPSSCCCRNTGRTRTPPPVFETKGF
jgi:hypothetical protein